jgi:hypothetical protein
MSDSPNLQLPFLDANQNQKHVTHNDALTILDALVNCAVVSTTATAPPASPGDGQRWIVAGSATGAWAGKTGTIAAWQDGAWTFFGPKPGYTAFAQDLGILLAWNGSAWVAAVPPSGGAPSASTSFVQALIFG